MHFYISRFKDLKRKEFECEIITPMLLGGADKKKAELRAASIKGVLRFWWRAINAHLPLNILKDNEAAIFGDAGSKYGKSKIQIKVLDAPKYDGNRANPVPHKDVRFAFPSFNPGEKFTLSLFGDYKVINLLKIVSILGGLGKRSRRGFGSFIIDKIDGESFVQPSSISDILNLLDIFAKDKFELLDKNTIKRIDELNAKFAYIKSITLGNGSNNYMGLLAKIGQSSHDNNSDYTGYARGEERLASPVYVSVVKDNVLFKPVITTLNTAFKDSEAKHSVDRSEQFKNDILAGGAK